MELLCQEGKLKPLFWGRVFDCLFTLGRLNNKAGKIHEHNDESQKGRQELLQPWLNCGEQLIKNKMIIPPIIGPWLAQLAYEEPKDQNGDMQWDEGSGCDEMFSYKLYWRYEPFYDARFFLIFCGTT